MYKLMTNWIQSIHEKECRKSIVLPYFSHQRSVGKTRIYLGIKEGECSGLPSWLLLDDKAIVCLIQTIIVGGIWIAYESQASVKQLS